MIHTGRYTLIYPKGDYRTVQIKTVKKGGLAGAVILSLKVGHEFEGVAFVQKTGKLNFWKRFKAEKANTPDRLGRIQKAVDRIVADPAAAGMAYALKENRCYRCGRELTVPASIHKGMGPECAKKNWTKLDQQEAYRWAQANAKEKEAAGSSLNQAEESVSSGRNMDDEWMKQKNLFAEEERKQEEKAFMSDPDLHLSWGGQFKPKQPRVPERPDLPEFENARCGICGVPRYRCLC